MTPFIFKINCEIFYYKVFIEHKLFLLHYKQKNYLITQVKR